MYRESLKNIALSFFVKANLKVGKNPFIRWYVPISSWDYGCSSRLTAGTGSQTINGLKEQEMSSQFKKKKNKKERIGRNAPKMQLENTFGAGKLGKNSNKISGSATQVWNGIHMKSLKV